MSEYLDLKQFLSLNKTRLPFPGFGANNGVKKFPSNKFLGKRVLCVRVIR